MNAGHIDLRYKYLPPGLFLVLHHCDPDSDRERPAKKRRLGLTSTASSQQSRKSIPKSLPAQDAPVKTEDSDIEEIPQINVKDKVLAQAKAMSPALPSDADGAPLSD
ncbi:hypothetical protein M407DRAFT_26584 [Tulasnella calospora MUT 4182]|uniref:Uncharacterized protein n=1 Tax=Tulasnella calospora MUT 4182 TaxID=1051891 RepID=A0A0C3QFF1_9AGAM|nr:hypothetical protein M407DRAFT_26584 [Tulasnella calospora MUT 4182]